MAKGLFTSDFVEGLRPDPRGKDRTYFDGAIPGFGLQVRPSGVMTYFLKYRDRYGRQHKFQIARVKTKGQAGITLAKAKVKAEIARGAVRERKDPAAEIRGDRNAKTVAQLCDEYLKASSNHLKPSTQAMNKSRIENHVKPLIGSKPVASLKQTDMEQFVAAIQAGKSPRKKRDDQTRGSAVRGGKSQATRTLEMLGTILEREVGDGLLLASNPVRKVRRPKLGRVKPPFSFAAVKAMGKAMRELEAEGEAPNGPRAVAFLLLSGFRRMEGLTLQWGTVDDSAHCARLMDTKTGPQTRPLGQAALEHLASFKPEKAKPKDYVFPGPGEAGHYVGAPKAMARICAKAGLSGISLHGLRHWFASAAAEMNYSELVIAGLLGHAVRSVTGRYATTPDSALVAAADAVAGRLAKAMN